MRRCSQLKDVHNLEDEKMLTIKRCSQIRRCSLPGAQFKGCKRPPGRFLDNEMSWLRMQKDIEEEA